MRNKDGRISDELRRKVLERDGYKCRYCGNTSGPFHMDHVYPYSKGGETTIDNLVTACSGCNSHKFNKVGLWPLPIQNKDIPAALLFGFFLILFGLASVTMVFSRILMLSADSYVKITILFGAIMISVGLYLFSKDMFKR